MYHRHIQPGLLYLYFTQVSHFLHLHTTLILLLSTSASSDVEKVADSLYLVTPLHMLAVQPCSITQAGQFESQVGKR